MLCGLDGIIPALAGNTLCGAVRIVSTGDHPRSRGEYDLRAPRGPSAAGSSPLSRGIQRSPTKRSCLTRIIPALAGNTVPRPPKPVVGRDHPRSRGEYPASPSRAVHSCGSSPLSRGILTAALTEQRDLRIIPALAGNTPRSPGRRRHCRDHPRSRGEYWEVRGGDGDGFRIIPALAGNTRGPRRVGVEPADHPRSRGEYPSQWATLTATAGSSPLSRGIQCRLPHL